jgi:hypothetical protein
MNTLSIQENSRSPRESYYMRLERAASATRMLDFPSTGYLLLD